MKSILICTNHCTHPDMPSCGARGALALKEQVTREIEKQKIELAVKEIQCLGECDSGPNIRLLPNGPLFSHVNIHDLDGLLETARKFSKS